MLIVSSSRNGALFVACRGNCVCHSEGLSETSRTPLSNITVRLFIGIVRKSIFCLVAFASFLFYFIAFYCIEVFSIVWGCEFPHIYHFLIISKVGNYLYKSLEQLVLFINVLYLYDGWSRGMMAYSIACLLTETGDAGSGPQVARWVFFNDVPWQNIAIYN